MSSKLIAQVTFVKPDGSYISVGHTIPEGLFTEDQIERLLKKGSVATIASMQAKLDGAAELPPVKLKPDWGFDPKSLVDDDLNTLNMKILEQATKLNLEIPPFEDAELARQFLSSQWEE